MKKTFFIIFMLIAITLVGCSSNNISSDVQKDSKKVYTILVDYMDNGEEISDSDQRKLDSFLTNAETKLDTYNEEEQRLVYGVLSMNQEVYYYKTYTKESDKLKAMERFTEQKDLVDTLIK